MNDDLGLRLITSAGRFTRELGRTTQGADGPSIWRSLAVVSELAPVSVGEFARHYRCSQPAATTLLKRLESEGAVEARANPRDGRIRAFVLTDAGRGRLEENRALAAGLLAAEMDGLAPGEREALAASVELLERFTHRLETAASREEPALREEAGPPGRPPRRAVGASTAQDTDTEIPKKGRAQE